MIQIINMHVAVFGIKHALATDPRLFLLFFPPSTSWRASKCSHEACQIVAIESRPLLTEQPMSPRASPVCAHTFGLACLHACLLFPWCSLAACRRDVMNERRWSRSLCVLGDPARKSPPGRTYWGLRDGWVLIEMPMSCCSSFSFTFSVIWENTASWS